MSQVSARWGMNRIRTIIEGEPNEISKSAATTTKSKIRQWESLTNETLTTHFSRSKNNLTKTSLKSTKTTMRGDETKKTNNRRSTDDLLTVAKPSQLQQIHRSAEKNPQRTKPWQHASIASSTNTNRSSKRNGNGENSERIKSLGTRPGNKIERSK